MCQRKKWFTVWSTEAVVVLTLWRLWKHVNSLLKAICVFAFQMYAPMIDHFNNRQSNKAASCTFLAPLSCFHFHDARLKEITVISPNLTFKVWQVCILTVSLAYVYKYTYVCVCVCVCCHQVHWGTNSLWKNMHSVSTFSRPLNAVFFSVSPLQIPKMAVVTVTDVSVVPAGLMSVFLLLLQVYDWLFSDETKADR